MLEMGRGQSTNKTGRTRGKERERRGQAAPFLVGQAYQAVGQVTVGVESTQNTNRKSDSFFVSFTFSIVN